MWNGRRVKRTRALGQNGTPLGVKWKLCHFAPTVPFCPTMPWAILPQRLRLEKSHYVNYNIARCAIKWCENANKRYIIIFNHMQRFYYFICQSNWCQNASKFFYQNGEISFLWDTQNVVYCKFDFDVWRWTGRWQKSNGRENIPTPSRLFSEHPVFHFALMFHFAPTYYIYSLAMSCQILLGYIFYTGTFWIEKKWLEYKMNMKLCIFIFRGFLYTCKITWNSQQDRFFSKCTHLL